jgi:regulatory protein|tara:strand:+ start:60252 stop:60704 length:453 start_codon:yes stop_codon:yes gene_type:complete
LTEEEKACKKKALDLLARREHSISELKHKLLDREFAIELVDRAIELLLKRNYLDDHRFAREFIDFKYSKGQGPIKIKSELKKKGVDKCLIDSLFNSLEYDWANLAQKVLNKKFKNSSIDNINEYGKRFRYLESRGFERKQVISVIGQPYE